MYIDEVHAAEILPKFALDPSLEICAHSISDLTGLKVQTTRKIVPIYNYRGWLAYSATVGHGAATRMHEVYKLSNEFWSDVEQIDLSLSERLNTSDLDVLNDAIAARAQIPLGRETDRSLQQEAVTYLGGVALLSKVHKIKDYGTWIGETEGWNSFITIKALGQ